jgi:N-acetylglucosaminyldiphosphoundecaprenol N-acetyl-beta-D-mannosaminyltransferase
MKSMIRKPVLGAPLDALSMSDMLTLCAETIAHRRRLLVGVVNAAKLVNMRRDASLRDAVLATDVILADGMAVVWAARLLGHRLPERVAGIDLMTRLLELADRAGHRVYCLGATDEVLAAVTREIAQRYPGVRLVGARHGYFRPEDEADIAAEIVAARPDILFVAMSPPKKEQFIARWGPELGVPICHGVGGAFDVIAGKTRRAPRLWQGLGLEWLYRVLQEPRRLWRRYLVTNTLFIGMVIQAWLRPLPQPQPQPVRS